MSIKNTGNHNAILTLQFAVNVGKNSCWISWASIGKPMTTINNQRYTSDVACTLWKEEYSRLRNIIHFSNTLSYHC